MVTLFKRITNSNSVPTMYTPHVLNSLRLINRVSEFVPCTRANCELCDYGKKTTKNMGPYEHLTSFNITMELQNAYDNLKDIVFPCILNVYDILWLSHSQKKFVKS